MKVFAAAALALSVLITPAFGQAPGGLKLPPGFHATVVADGLTGIRHMAVRSNGDLYVSTRAPAGQPSQGILGLRMSADGKFQMQPFSVVNNGTGIRIHGNAIYASALTGVYRWTFTGDDIVPVPSEQPLIEGLPDTGFVNRMFALDDSGGLYLSVPATGNVCTAPNEQPGVKPVGLRPCPALETRSGIWRFSATKLGQKFPGDGVRIAMGTRDVTALDWRRNDGLYIVMHGRGGTSATWPDLVTPADDDAIAEEMHRVTRGSSLGWPYTYYDGVRNMRLLAPEYGGDGKTAPTEAYNTPVTTFSGHAAPLDLAFYYGTQFPKEYRGGAFVAFHGGGVAGGYDDKRAGFNVVFVPFANGKPGAWKIFADGFAGPDAASKVVATSAHRPVGLAVSPDGSLFVADDKKGRIWRITYGEPKPFKAAVAPPARPFGASRP